MFLLAIDKQSNCQGFKIFKCTQNQELNVAKYTEMIADKIHYLLIALAIHKY